MRVLLIALLIALLPVRGWVGGAMAISFAPASHEVHAVADLDAHDMHDNAHAHMPMNHGAMDDTAQDTADSAGSHHAHSACEVCNGPVMAAPEAPALAMHVRTALRADRVERFTSSQPHAGLKPPIA